MSVYGAWAFDEGSGSTIIDYSGNSRNMTVSGSNSWIAGEGAYANAFQAGASGSDGAIWNNGSAIAALSGDVTVQLWYQHTTTSNTISHAGGLYSSPGTSRLSVYSWRNRPAGVISSSPHATLRDSASTIFDAGVNGTSTDSSWHNVAWIYHSNGTIDEYLDGTLLSPVVSPTHPTARRPILFFHCMASSPSFKTPGIYGPERRNSRHAHPIRPSRG